MQQIPGFTDYAADEQGNIYSLKFNKIRKLKGAVDKLGYLIASISTAGKVKKHKMHRLIAKTFLEDYSEDLQVDHIDRCKNNNSLDNLRMVTSSENRQNSDAKGYSWDKSSQKWKARIMINNNLKHLGYYDTEEEAREAYLKGKEKYHTH